jgi:putative transposase
MSIPAIYKAPFVENDLYHVYNRTNNKELLFINDTDRILFLQKFDLYISPFADTFTFNLLPNHFHFYIRIKNYNAIYNYLKKKNTKELCTTERRFLKEKATVHDLVDNSFRRFFISYTTNFNNAHYRKGNLFNRPFKHVLTDKESQFSQTIIYINANAIKHKLVKKLEDHKWSSYLHTISDAKTNILRKELFEWFGGISQFIKVHKEQTQYYYLSEAAIDDY